LLNAVEFIVVGSRAAAMVPVEIEEAFRAVMFAPLKVAVLDPVPPLATATMPVTFAALPVVD
jgi:hypothetical protein